MMRFIAFLELLIVIMANQKEMQVGNYTARILGRSGKMKLWNSDKSLEISFRSLKELTADKNEAFQSHGFESFATQDFTFAEPVTGEWDADDCCGPSTVSYKSIRYSGEVSRPQSGKLGDMWVETVLFEESGRIIVNDGEEKFDVSAGVMKWTVGIDNWNWCVDQCCNGNQCESAVGEFIEFAVEVKIGEESQNRRFLQDVNTTSPTMEPTMSPTTNPTFNPTMTPTQSPVEPNFDLGNGTSMVISDFVRVGTDQTLQALPDFSFSHTGNTHTFKFVFPKSDKILYDPLVGLDETETSTTTQPGSWSPSLQILFSNLILLLWCL